MTLADLLSQPLPDLVTLRGHWLVFDAELLSDFNEAQAGATSFLAAPTALTDGRFALCADLLTEVGEGGVYAESFARLPSEKFALVDVVSQAALNDVWPEPYDE